MLLLIFEVLFAASFVAGVGFIYWPAALLVAGVLGVIACERASNRMATRAGGE